MVLKILKSHPQAFGGKGTPRVCSTNLVRQNPDNQLEIVGSILLPAQRHVNQAVSSVAERENSQDVVTFKIFEAERIIICAMSPKYLDSTWTKILVWFSLGARASRPLRKRPRWPRSQDMHAKTTMASTLCPGT